jgi:mono/diheme cytochrome c family protein
MSHRKQKASARAFALFAALLAIVGGSASTGSHAEGVGMFGATKLTTTSGAEIFRTICQGCHMPDAKGAVGAGRYPALAGDAALASKEFMIVTLLQGRRNMPAFGGNGDIGLFFTLPTLTDEQIAAVINYVRSNFGNDFKGTVTAAEVKADRHAQ